jgi:hypothetical protein
MLEARRRREAREHTEKMPAAMLHQHVNGQVDVAIHRLVYSNLFVDNKPWPHWHQLSAAQSLQVSMLCRLKKKILDALF